MGRTGDVCVVSERVKKINKKNKNTDAHMCVVIFLFNYYITNVVGNYIPYSR